MTHWVSWGNSSDIQTKEIQKQISLHHMYKYKYKSDDTDAIRPKQS